MKKHTQWIIGSVMLLTLFLLLPGCARKDPGLFETPEAAVQALDALIGQNDDAQIEALFGAGSADLFRSGDPDADAEDGQRVKAMIAEGVAFEDFDESTKLALLGADQWPFPIPLRHEEGGWRFDTASGREEVLNRRIGRNELWTLTAMHEVVDAQREYRSQGRDGNLPAFAQKFRSSEGKQDGLYWPSDDESNGSPLGDQLADSENWSEELHAFHGYFYRIMTRQGPNAPGGEQDYLDAASGLLTNGFAVIAWPAKYGNSGVMTFITNHRGLVYQKDLGADTEQAVAAIQAYDPDESWTPTGDEMTEADPEE